MPMIRSRIEPTRLLGSTDSASDLTDSINSICANIIRQLSSLCEGAGDMFDDLLIVANRVSERTRMLNDRVVRLKDISSKLNPVSEEVSPDDLASRKPFRSSTMKDASLTIRPHAVVAVYEQCDAVPALNKLNQYRLDGKDCLKLYTNPDYFFESWSSQIKQEVEGKRPKGNKRKVLKETANVRAPAESKQQQMRRKFEEESGGGTIPRQKQPNPPLAGSGISTNQQEGVQPRARDSNNNSPASSRPPSGVSLNRLSSTARPPQPPPAPPLIQSGSPSPSKYNPPASPGPPPSPCRDSMPPPPPPLPTNVMLRNGGGVNRSGKEKSLYTVTEFDGDSLLPPPPPPPDDDGSEYPAFPSAIPPAPFQAPPPPPPVPPPMGGMMDTGFGLKRQTVVGAPAKTSAPQKSEPRVDLLQSIRSGIQLRKVADEGTTSVPGVTTKPAASSSGAGSSNVFDVQAILEMRRRAFEDEDDEDGDDGEWED